MRILKLSLITLVMCIGSWAMNYLFLAMGAYPDATPDNIMTIAVIGGILGGIFATVVFLMMGGLPKQPINNEPRR